RRGGAVHLPGRRRLVCRPGRPDFRSSRAGDANHRHLFPARRRQADAGNPAALDADLAGAGGAVAGAARRHDAGDDGRPAAVGLAAAGAAGLRPGDVLAAAGGLLPSGAAGPVALGPGPGRGDTGAAAVAAGRTAALEGTGRLVGAPASAGRPRAIVTGGTLSGKIKEVDSLVQSSRRSL